jgi:transposase InsO family protein
MTARELLPLRHRPTGDASATAARGASPPTHQARSTPTTTDARWSHFRPSRRGQREPSFSAGRWLTTCAQSSSSTRCRWPSPGADPSLGSFITPTGDPKRVSGLRSGRPRCRHRPLNRSKGDCYDNAVAESFFATLKKELVHRRSGPTRREFTTEVFDYIEAFYNRTRRHSTLGMLRPLDYENSTLREHRIGLAAFAARIHPDRDHQHLESRKPNPVRRTGGPQSPNAILPRPSAWGDPQLSRPARHR